MKAWNRFHISTLFGIHRGMKHLTPASQLLEHRHGCIQPMPFFSSSEGLCCRHLCTSRQPDGAKSCTTKSLKDRIKNTRKAHARCYQRPQVMTAETSCSSPRPASESPPEVLIVQSIAILKFTLRKSHSVLPKLEYRTIIIIIIITVAQLNLKFWYVLFDCWETSPFSADWYYNYHITLAKKVKAMLPGLCTKD